MLQSIAKHMISPAFKNTSTEPRSITTIVIGTSCFSLFSSKKIYKSMIPSLKTKSAPASCFSHPSEVYTMVAKTLITNLMLTTLSSAIPAIKSKYPYGPNGEKSVGRNQ